jgi:NTP pyrophosphatase (non-canonical NTP hydrolase)
MDLREAQESSGQLDKKFRQVRRQHWKPEVMLTDLVEEVGELANAILTREAYKSEKRNKADLADSLCDVLLAVFMISEHYGVSLEKEFPKVLQHIEKRLEDGDFDD